MVTNRYETENHVTLDKITYDSLQEELNSLRRHITSLENNLSCSVANPNNFHNHNLNMGILIEQIPLAVAMFDKDMCYLLASRRWTENHGYHDQNIIGCDHQTVCPSYAREWKSIHELCLATSQPQHEIIDCLDAQGKKEWWQWSVYPWYEANGNVGGTIIVAEVVTKHKQTEEQLRESQQLLQLVMDNIPQSIFWKDSNLVYLGCNRQFAQDANWDLPENVVGKTDHDFPWTPEEAEFFRECDRRVMESGKPQLCIIEPQQRSDGKQYWLETNKIPLRNAQGEVIGLLGTYEDITIRKQAEETLKQLNEELETRVGERTAELEILINELKQQIKERVAAEEKLRRSEERLQQLGENIPGMLCEFCLEPDGETSFAYVSSGAKDVYEIEPEALKEDADLAFNCVNPEDLPGMQASISYSAQTLSNWEYEWRIITPTGKRKWLKGESRPQLQEDGRIIWYGYVTDISDRKQTEVELAKLSLVASKTDNAVIITDADGLVEWVNDGFSKITGYSLEEVQGKKPGSMLQGGLTNPQTIRNIRKATRARQPFQGEILNYHKDGHPYWLYLQINPIFDGQDNLVKFIAIESDVTEQKQAAVALAEQFRLTAFRADVDSALTKGKDIKAMTQSCTEAMVNHLDATFALIWSLNQAENTLELQACSSFYSHIDSALRCIPVGKFKIGLIAKEKSPYLTNTVLENSRICDPEWAQQQKIAAFAGYPLMDNEEVWGVIAMFSRQPLDDSILQALELASHEITLGMKRYQAEIQLRERTQQLEDTLKELRHTQAQVIQTEKMSSLGQMVAGVAHEINNPVNFIHGNLGHTINYTQDIFGLIELYQQHYPDPPAEIAEEIDAIDLEFLQTDFPKLLKSMEVGTERIREIVLSLRNFSRLDEADYKEVDLHEGLDSTLMILQNRLKSKRNRPAIKVVKEYEKLPLVNCYAGQLNQVFMNIFSNGIDALEESFEKNLSSYSGQSTPDFELSITIRTELLEENWVAIRIIDNGGGIEEEVLSKLFDPFFTTKPVGKGTGLGLSISYQIVVEKHGGKIECYSQINEGTEFLIKLPIENNICPAR